VAQQSVNKIISLTILDLVTPKAGAKQELLFNKQASGLLRKNSSLARDLGVTKFVKVIVWYLVTLCCSTEVGLRCSTKCDQIQPIVVMKASVI
jgi:hypothetical protein